MDSIFEPKACPAPGDPNLPEHNCGHLGTGLEDFPTLSHAGTTDAGGGATAGA